MTRIIGSLRTERGTGVVVIEDRFDTTVDDLWTSITEPERLERWYGTVNGDLRPGGTFNLFVAGSGWEGTGRIDECAPPDHLVITTRQTDESWQDGEQAYEEVIDATLAADADQVLLRVEVRGLPVPKVAYYGAGWQLNVEHLADEIAGRQPTGEERFAELVPAYLEQAAALG